MEPFLEKGGWGYGGVVSGMKLKGYSPYAANKALPPMTPILEASPTFDMSFVIFLFACGQ